MLVLAAIPWAGAACLAGAAAGVAFLAGAAAGAEGLAVCLFI